MDLWRGVQRVTKKDGSNFKVLSKNFSGAVVRNNEYSLRDDPELRVSKFVKAPLYDVVADEIKLVEMVKYTDLNPDADRVIKEVCLEPYFFLTVDEIFDKIAAHIARLEKQLADYKADLAVFDSTFETFAAAINAALADVIKADGDNNTLYYMAREYMQSVY